MNKLLITAAIVVGSIFLVTANLQAQPRTNQRLYRQNFTIPVRTAPMPAVRTTPFAYPGFYAAGYNPYGTFRPGYTAAFNPYAYFPSNNPYVYSSYGYNPYAYNPYGYNTNGYNPYLYNPYQGGVASYNPYLPGSVFPGAY